MLNDNSFLRPDWVALGEAVNLLGDFTSWASSPAHVDGERAKNPGTTATLNVVLAQLEDVLADLRPTVARLVAVEGGERP